MKRMRIESSFDCTYENVSFYKLYHDFCVKPQVPEMITHMLQKILSRHSNICFYSIESLQAVKLHVVNQGHSELDHSSVNCNLH